MRYFFHLRTGEQRFIDMSGENADESELLNRAVADARDMLRTNGISVRHWLAMSYEITDAGGALVLSVPFTEALDATLE
jgi:hypothetical protein